MTFLDLFCGCGGFSLGMERAGFRCLAAIDFNPEAIATFRANFPSLPAERIRREDLTQFRPADLVKIIGDEKVDVIAGGPPCQGFSTARQRDGANQGTERFVEDPRRQLYKEFLRYVEFFKPRVFVMENVLGIQSAAGGQYFTRVQHEARQLGYRVVPQIADAFALGVPQKRRRQLIIGVRADIPGYFPGELAPAPRAFPGTTLGPAIGDLPRLAAGGGIETCDYDPERRRKHLVKWGKVARRYLHSVLEIARAPQLTAHRARPHSERDLRDFALLAEGQSSADAMRHGIEFEFPYDKTSFKDRYTRQSHRRPCSTIVAHLSKDGLMFIHPTQNRSLTPREAARIQSFPDWFQFPVARTHQYRIIGNAVPPLVAEAVGLEVRAFLRGQQVENRPVQWELEPLPENETQAVEWLRPLLDIPPLALRRMESGEFKRAWFAIAFIFAGLHPDSALDHGETTRRESTEDYEPVSSIEPRLLAPYYERSGWPVILAPIAREAWRRWRNEELSEEEFYCCEAQQAGMCHRNPELDQSVTWGRARLRREIIERENQTKRKDLWPDGISMN